MSDKEYIDREALKRDLIDNRSFFPVIVKRAIETAPAADVVPRAEVERLKHILNCYALQYGTVVDADVVEVVRCKDCEYCEVLDMDYGGKQYWCKFWSTPKREYAEAYCCHGERKDQNG